MSNHKLRLPAGILKAVSTSSAGNLELTNNSDGYGMTYYTREADKICPACADAAYKDWAAAVAAHTASPDDDTMHLVEMAYEELPTDCEVWWEGAPDQCVSCNTCMTSEYGDPEEETSNGAANL